MFSFFLGKSYQPSEVEDRVLFAVRQTMQSGRALASQEDVARLTGINKYLAFKIMESLRSHKLLQRYGWNFTLTDEGEKYVSENCPFAEQVRKLPYANS
jgi:hypothetical protein